MNNDLIEEDTDEGVEGEEFENGNFIMAERNREEFKLNCIYYLVQLNMKVRWGLGAVPL